MWFVLIFKCIDRPRFYPHSTRNGPTMFNYSPTASRRASELSSLNARHPAKISNLTAPVASTVVVESDTTTSLDLLKGIQLSFFSSLSTLDSMTRRDVAALCPFMMLRAVELKC